jgi:hypothetical protein
MRWPSDLPDPIRRRILGLWSAANGATSVHERAKALTALGQLQRNHELSDVALNFIAESELQQPSRDVPKNIPNIVVLIFELIRLVGIVTSLEIALTSAFWLLHTYIFHLFTYTPRFEFQAPFPRPRSRLSTSSVLAMTIKNWCGEAAPSTTRGRLSLRRSERPPIVAGPAI